MYVTEAIWYCSGVGFDITVALLLYIGTPYLSACVAQCDVPLSPSADGQSSAKFLGVAFVQPHRLVAFHMQWQENGKLVIAVHACNSHGPWLAACIADAQILYIVRSHLQSVLDRERYDQIVY
jgi:hypothetical protein